MKKVINNSGVDRTQALWRYVTGQGIPAWSSSADYFPGDTAMDGNFGFYCCVANSDKQPSTNASYWKPYDAVGTGARDIIVKDFYFIGPPVFYPNATWGSVAESNYGAYPIVDGDYPISYQPYQSIPFQTFKPVIMFQPFAIEKDKLSYKTGFEASSLALTLRPRDPKPQTDPLEGSFSPYRSRGVESAGFGESTSFQMGVQTKPPYSDVYSHVNDGDGNIYQTMRQSFAQTTDWYLAPITMFRGFSPAGQPGDLDTFGAAVMFRGRISETTVDREDVKITAASLMEIFKQKVPSQTVQPGNRWAPFDFQHTEDFFGSMSGSSVTGGYNWATLNCGYTGFPTPDLQDGTLNEGWALIYNGNGVWWRKIYNNVGTYVDTNPSSPTYQVTFTTVILLENLPIKLTDPDSPVVEMRLWTARDTATNPSGPGSGFPYVPQPLTGIA